MNRDKLPQTLEELLCPKISFYVLPGGKMPKRQSRSAIGWDACLRAIVSEWEMDPNDNRLRKTLFDFNGPSKDPLIVPVTSKYGNEWVYRLDPGKSVLAGIGFATQMPDDVFYWIAPRSGLASKYRITLANAPGTVDPDYRGEAGVIIDNMSDKPFALRHNMRIAQIIFQRALIPVITEVINHNELKETDRGAGGFGSTGGLGGEEE